MKKTPYLAKGGDFPLYDGCTTFPLLLKDHAHFKYLIHVSFLSGHPVTLTRKISEELLI